jgi:hypothetical protein
MLLQRVTENAPSLRELAPMIPAPLSDVVGKALARVPGDRYQAASEFAQNLERALRS